ncbi:hypothetical protein [Actinoplanes derwentensis]|uniref:hypothetical protein n=1 Tax=Actinoplanes derwentensis TaxID=113562 RepID=UPI001941206D|nr:hypothetical protein [Actinoplanes derwentensis]
MYNTGEPHRRGVVPPVSPSNPSGPTPLAAQRIGRLLAIGAQAELESVHTLLTGVRVPEAALCVMVLGQDLIDAGVLAAHCRNAVTDGSVVILVQPRNPGQPSVLLADQLSRLLDREVWAADGPVTIIPGGSLYVADPGTDWWARPPRHPAKARGRRFPVPRWQQVAVTAGPEIVEIPAGWWLPGPPVTGSDDLPFAVPQNDRLFTVLLGDGAPLGEQTLNLIATLPADLRQRLLLAPYGASAARVAALAQQVAETYGHPVSAATGTPLVHPDERVHATVLAGSEAWCRLAERLVYSPQQPPVVTAWTPLSSDLPAAGRATYPLADGWETEVTAFGLWLRPRDVPAGIAAAVRSVPPDEQHLLVRAGASGGSLTTAQFWAAARELLDGLPAETRARVRLQLPADTAPGQVALAAEALPADMHAHQAGSDPGWCAIADLFGRSDSTMAMTRPRIAAGDGVQVARPIAPGVFRFDAESRTTSLFAPVTEPAMPDAAMTVTPRTAPVTFVPPGVPAAGSASVAPSRSGSEANSGPRELPGPADPFAAPASRGGAASTDNPADAKGSGTPAPRPGLDPGHSMALSAFRKTEKPLPAPRPAVPEPTRLHPDIALAPTTTPAPTLAPTAPFGEPETFPAPEPSDTLTPVPAPEPSSTPIAAPGPRVPTDAPENSPAATPESPPVPVPPAPPIAESAPAAETPPATAPVTENRPAVPSSPGAPMPLPDRLRSADHQSLPAERERLRAALAWRFDSHVRAVTRMLARLPGLRPTADKDEALLTDLTAVRAVLTGDRSVVDEALRGSRPPVDPALISCLMAGLLRLPTCRAPVYRYQPAAGTDYVTGQVLVEPSLLSARAFPRQTPPDHQELVIWSTTGRRVEGLVDADRADEVIFAAGARFAVLATEPGRVYLSETTSGTPGDRERRILQRLQQYVTRRPEPTQAAEHGALLLGLDAGGMPYPVPGIEA